MEFQPDCIISWDFTNPDMPTVSVARLRAEKKATMLTIDILDVFNSDSGVCSVRQLVEEFEKKQAVGKIVESTEKWDNTDKECGTCRHATAFTEDSSPECINCVEHSNWEEDK